MRTFVLCISGPSGVGKGTICRELLKRDPSLCFSVSCTTRPPRRSERHGKDYFFITKEQFEAGIAAGEFVEYDSHFGNYYGTPRAYVEAQMQAGKCVILEIDVVGTEKVRRSLGKRAVTVFIAPPSEEELKKRLIGRGTEDGTEIGERLARLGYELSKSQEYDYVVVNGALSRAVEELAAIIEREKHKECE